MSGPRLTGRFFHRTTRKAASAILLHGFKDATGTHGTGSLHTGIWISNVPVDSNEGAKGDVLLEVRIPARLISRYEWIEKVKPYREFMVPAALLNQRARVREASER
jgi:hypothetical protein